MKPSLIVPLVAAIPPFVLLAAAAIGCSSSSGAPPANGASPHGEGDDASTSSSSGGSSSGGTSGGSGSSSGGSGSSSGGEAADAAPAPLDDAGLVVAMDGATVEDFNPTAADFQCLTDWTQVNSYRIINKLGHMSEALAVANSPDGGTFPVGTIIQLIPGEASVKRAAGYSPSTDDWEFFALNTSSTGTVIAMSGTTMVSNALGTCLSCHGKAAPQWDFVCGDTHGCPSLGLNGMQIATFQTSDPRCP